MVGTIYVTGTSPAVSGGGGGGSSPSLSIDVTSVADVARGQTYVRGRGLVSTASLAAERAAAQKVAQKAAAKAKAIEVQKEKARQRGLQLLAEQKAAREFAVLSKKEQRRQLVEASEQSRVAQLLKEKPSAILTPEAQRIKERIEKKKGIAEFKEKISRPSLIERDTFKAKAKRFGVSLFTPSISTKAIKDLPKKERGLESAKGIFLGGFEGLYQYAKKGGREVSVKLPVYTGILTPIIGKKKPIDLGKVKPSRVAAEFIPRTTAEVLALRYFPKLPKAVQIPATGVITGLGVRGALDVSRTKEERIASGIIGIGAGVGTAVQVAPYARGLKAQTIGRLTGQYKPTKVQLEGFKAIQLKETRIGLIPEKAPLKIGITKDIKLSDISPLKRGGFGVTPSQKKLFLGKGQILATSQRGLFKEGVTIKPSPTAPKEFFVSPQDPFAKIPITRVSRLGLEKPFKIPKQVKIGFGIPKKPQIGLEYGAKVGRVEKAGAFRIGTGTELEAIKTLPTIKVLKKLGITTMKGQAVELFKIKTTPTKGVVTPRVPTTEGITRVSGEAALVSYQIIPSVPTAQVTQALTPTVPISTPTLPTPLISTPVSSRAIPRRELAPPTPSIRPPTKVFTIITPPISPPTRLPKRRILTRKILTRISPPITPTKKPLVIIPRLGRKRRDEELLPTYGVEVRRYGKFRPIGTGLSLKQAFAVGRERVGKTLGATFKIIGKPRGLKIPKGFYAKPTKTGTLFIEKRKFRLSTYPEVKEIHVAKRRKRK